MTTTSEANKIRKEMLAASDQAKARICRQIRKLSLIRDSRHIPVERRQQFLDYCTAYNFEKAITYLHDEILPP